jgi:cytochrome c5
MPKEYEMKKAIILSVLMMFGAVAQAEADDAVIDMYQKGCFACHGTGMAGVPQAGAAADWAPRLEKGMDVLLDHAEKGFNAMPPKGMCPSCSRDELKALIVFMSTSK